MAIFKCKMCGGTLEVNENQTTAVCDYCGTQQTLPKLDDEKRANLYDRANHFRRNNEFDKAASIYETILNEESSDAEAYWSLVLCRYGIEYVEEPSTRKRVPTVNRAQFTSIFDDNNYKSALKYADTYQRSLYEAEAKAINEIQKGILAISQKEEPFDVFICYKETDNNGRRTQDSVLANDLYHQLTNEGYKVFFSRITLEDKLGIAYEPYIFAALNSAKVMVVLGTRPEYFNAVWVKNEWSRYLALVKQSAGKKVLIPAYRDMDPYDLPEEFSHLQAQDMSKLGFMQDLIRGIKKLVQTEENKTTVKETIVMGGGNVAAAPLLKRAFLYLEDGEWDLADEYCEKVLDLDPENGEAYLGKLMVELQCSRKDDLKDVGRSFEQNNNYKKAIRFSVPEQEDELKGYVNYINERNRLAELDMAYNTALISMYAAANEEEYKEVAGMFAELSGYKDSFDKKNECLEKAEVAKEGINDGTIHKKIYFRNSESFESANGDEKNVDVFTEIVLSMDFKNISNYKIHTDGRIYIEKDNLDMIIAVANGVTVISDFAFAVCSNIADIILPDSITSIGEKAFNGCKNLSSIIIPDGVTSIGNGAFLGCSSLSSITIPDSVTSIGEYAFYKCSSLSSITIPDSVTSIGAEAFWECEKLSSITIPDSVTSIGAEAFWGCEKLSSITIPDSVTSIGEHAFSWCEKLSSITIPDSVTSIGAGTFSDCVNLSSITIPDSVTSIGEKAFTGCEKLSSITIPDSVTSIGEHAFYGCDNLSSITIPDGVTYIGDEAFMEKVKLTKTESKNDGIKSSDEEFIHFPTSSNTKDSNETTNQTGGCYVATAIYGSYNCPQVWVLRRYRDGILAKKWYGRIFIRMYYLFSPTLVKWFGKKNWFKKMWIGKLDKLVDKLKTNGVADTPYEDREW